ncbi:uncharacterized protein LOC131955460 isoform X2 [Physella acuta]|uniref:uncharacterized protein LOC131955460 isoform X2 n=1 Tax=Physella acuta TaxID=109671 RepID=UPI0027DDB298|nr:uncharacterized protein LOC131955460 isoform X2 [Physella acuta]
MAGDKSKLGKFIMRYGAGESFGEASLLADDKLRSATVVADDHCQLMVIDQALFDTALKSQQEQMYKEISQFIEATPLFSRMSHKFKRIVQLSLRKVQSPLDAILCHQGRPVAALFFILSGQATINVDTGHHQQQYPHLLTPDDSFGHHKMAAPSVREKARHHKTVERQGKKLCLCSVQSGEVIGDLEVVYGLDTHFCTVQCTTDTAIFVLNMKNVERLLGKRNRVFLETLKENCKAKLKLRACSQLGSDVPLLARLLLDDVTRPASLPVVEKIRNGKNLPSRDVQLRHMLVKFEKGEAALIEPMVPGALIYRDQMRERARIRANIRRRSTFKSMVTESKRRSSQRQARSRRAILQALHELMTEPSDDQQPDGPALDQPPPHPHTRTDPGNDVLQDEVTVRNEISDQSHKQADKVKSFAPADKKVDFDFASGHVIEEAKDENLVTSRQSAALTGVGQGGRLIIEYQSQNVDSITGTNTRFPPLVKSEVRLAQVSVRQTARPDLGSRDELQTSDRQLEELEARVKNFLLQHFNVRSCQLPHLQRQTSCVTAKPGGKVWIKKVKCPFASSNVHVSNHNHVRYHMTPGPDHFRPSVAGGISHFNT